MRHAQILLRNIDQKNRDNLESLKMKCMTLESEIDKADQLSREMKDMHEFEL